MSNDLPGRLLADLASIHKHGLPEDVEAISLPALAALAEQTSDDQNDGSPDYLSQQVEALLRRALKSLKTTERRKRGIETLLDLAGPRASTMKERRERAAPILGYKDSETLRRGEYEGRSTEAVILEDVQTALLELSAAWHSTKRISKPRPRTNSRKPASPNVTRAESPPSDRRPVTTDAGVKVPDTCSDPGRISLQINRRKALRTLVADGAYTHVDPRLFEMQFRLPPKGGRVVGKLLTAKTLVMGATTSTDEVARKIRNGHLRQASLVELLALGAQYPAELTGGPIVALGARGRAGQNTFVAYLGAARTLQILSINSGWPSGYRFLAIQP